jgi:hypothetical protein
MPVVDMNGTSLDVVQAGAGPDLVLLHSLLGDRTAFDRVVPALAGAAGYGSSTCPDTAPRSRQARASRITLTALRACFRRWGCRNERPSSATASAGSSPLRSPRAMAEKFGRLVVADSLVAFPAPAKEPLRILAERVRKEGMSGALDIAIRRMFPEPFAASEPGNRCGAQARARISGPGLLSDCLYGAHPRRFFCQPG